MSSKKLRKYYIVYKSFGKRVFDIVATAIGGLILLPIIIIISIWIKLSSKGPLFYVQTRVGKDFQPFKLYKFRSMIVNADKVGPSVTSGDDPRITKVGKIIRRTKIDELPQLLNVLKGDMSLVGPRPEVQKFVDIKKEDYKKVLSVKPGITDNAAIEYRDEEKIMNQYEDKETAYIDIVLPEKIKLYNQYIDNISFLNDFKLILKTLHVI
ncbi:sugar transferase [Sulfurovum sp. CS9]|uniref:sugar transferase n=1 Tax=Sulfurovum sp. CS9 TaxID=3391146 RepID=UPI0039EA3601